MTHVLLGGGKPGYNRGLHGMYKQWKIWVGCLLTAEVKFFRSFISIFFYFITKVTLLYSSPED